MIIETFPVGVHQSNCSIIGCPETRDAIVVDPGEDVDRILSLVEHHRLRVIEIALTHAHLDHIGGVAALKKATGATVSLHSEDSFLYDNIEMQARMLGFPAPESVPVDRALSDGDLIEAGTLCGRTLHTPGHSPGSVCFHFDGETPRLFSGDTLFFGGIGRTDIMGGSYEAIIHSIKEKLLALDDATEVITGHGPATTIGRERTMNPFIAVEAL